MKRILALALGTALLAAPCAAAEVKIALDTAPDLETSGSYNWAHAFGKVLAERGMEVRELPRGAVGGEAEILDQLSTGLLEVALSDVKSVAKIDPFIYGVRLPYIFDDVAHMDRVLETGGIFERVNEAIAGADVRLVGLVPLGPQSGIITTKTAVRTPEDMASLRMRALDDAQIALYQAWGSSGTIVPWNEVPAGLQTGLIDGYLNSPFVPIMFGQTDIVKNYADAGVIVPLRAAIISKGWYEGLSAEDQAAVDAAVQAADQATREWLDRVNTSSLAALEEKGVTVQRLTGEERAAFREKSKPVYNSGLLPEADVALWTSLSEETR